MIQIELSTLISKLNAQARLALEQAGALCVERANPEVTATHWLVMMLDNPLSDIRCLLSAAKIATDDVRQRATEALSREVSHGTTPVFSPLLIELLQDAWLLGSTELGQESLRSGVMLLAALLRPERYLPSTLAALFAAVNRETLRRNFHHLTVDSAESPVIEAATGSRSAAVTVAETALERFCNNLTEQARQGELDPVLCRDGEMDQMIDILCRRRKNNPIVVGDAGVGKSAVVEGLAQRIIANQVPDRLQGVELLALDLGRLQAGASVKGEFEKRLKGILDEVKSSPVPLILFIDEAHTLIGAGNPEGGGDAANLLKPALARGELRTIAASTWKEYKKYVEKDPALSRRFQPVKLMEPTVGQTVDILRGLHATYEQAHQVLISDDALQAAAELSARYLCGRQLPDKAIDVLDTACARIAINLTSPPRQLTTLETRAIQRQREIDLLKRQQRLSEVVDEGRLAELTTQECVDQATQDTVQAAWETQQALVNELITRRRQVLQQLTEGAAHDEEPASFLRALQSQWEAIADSDRLLHPHVDRQQVAEVIADWTGVPLSQMGSDELSRITQLPDRLRTVITGQDYALTTIHRHLLTARADLRRPGRPQGAFLLVGPSGVGKTETVIQIAEQLYGGRQFLTTINMSEYQEKHTVSRLIGSPPGYVGYGEGGLLTEAIRKMPYSVVLLDEVEKAHPDVLNLFYQAFDKGELADGEGRVMDCQNILFFLTSNLGYQTIVDCADQPEALDEQLYPELAAFFKPALLARMEVVPYWPLAPETLRTIIIGKLSRLARLFQARYQAEADIDDAVVEAILNRATRAENGARMLEAIIDGQLLPPVSLALLNRMATGEAVRQVRLTVIDGEFAGYVN